MSASDDVCAVVLAAGLGTRLRPLTTLVPKALAPVGNVPLLDRALDRLAAAGFAGPGRIAVNAHHHAEQIVAHVGQRTHVSVEPEPLGSAGALGKLHDWIDGRAVLVLNSDAYVSAPTGDLRELLDGWDGRTVRMLGHTATDGHPPFGGLAFAGASLLPASEAAALKPELSHLVLTTWRPAERSGRLQSLPLDGVYIDCGTPSTYLEANLHSTGGTNLIGEDAVLLGTAHGSVIGPRAVVRGVVKDCVIWPDAHVGADEVLTGAIRAGRDLTVKVTHA